MSTFHVIGKAVAAAKIRKADGGCEKICVGDRLGWAHVEWNMCPKPDVIAWDPEARVKVYGPGPFTVDCVLQESGGSELVRFRDKYGREILASTIFFNKVSAEKKPLDRSLYTPLKSYFIEGGEVRTGSKISWISPQALNLRGGDSAWTAEQQKKNIEEMGAGQFILDEILMVHSGCVIFRFTDKHGKEQLVNAAFFCAEEAIPKQLG